MLFPFVYSRVLTAITVRKQRIEITNMVMLAVTRRIQGDADAPTVPIELTHPQLKADTSVGNNSETKTKNTPHAELIKNRSIAIRTISMMVWQLISLLTWVQVNDYMPIIKLMIAIIVIARVIQNFLCTFGTIKAPNIEADIQTMPTSIWSKQTLIPNLFKLSRVPSKTNQMTKLMKAATMVMYLRESQRKRSNKFTSLFYEGREQSANTLSTSSASSSSLPLNLAILLNDNRKAQYPFLIVNYGVYSTIVNAIIDAKLGMSIKNPKVYFHSLIKQERREISATPREKAS